ncbi:hypothetical protein [Yersinia intermedia]|uniref:hypothetical protein n=1 Tax=Yersinia intermedia TaxID=631 RepID=UPI0022FE07E5|nr:hypothetical protein [Yersinia intermedia]MDA5514163.1 hypothetical protein [Yersinia intermedia]
MGNSTNQKPSIQTAGMTEKELNAWLSELSSTANQIYRGAFHFAGERLPSVAATLREVLEDTSRKINYLDSDKIIRAEDQTIAIQADLSALREIWQSTHDSLQTIESCLPMLFENRERYWRQLAQAEDQESLAQETGLSDSDRKSLKPHLHKACE